ncbi:hypothetical protein FGIG_12634 [Fasciola gigantica]|uniref:Uncharacterized protein n=1 Tax=Fasciola gigantica TaxID=46835 RepID=A0A504YLU3_FASGI|nr:hypothetical protein FGIG_12634 [Fasciola gigantica]
MDNFYSMEGHIIAYINHCELEAVYERPFAARVRLFFDLEHHPRDSVGDILRFTQVLLRKVDHSKYGLHFGELYNAYIVKSRSWIDDL